MHPDIAVIGGSLTGLFSAGRLAGPDRKVSLVERSPTLEAPPRTLIVTRRMMDLVGDAGRHSVMNEIRRFELYADGKVAAFDLREPDLIIERTDLIRELAERAAGAGVDFHLGRRFIGFGANGDGLKVSFGRNGDDPEDVEVGTLIGADGAGSRVARAAGWPERRRVPLLQAIVRLPEDTPSDTTKVWFRPQDTRYFYWMIPESEERAAVGVIGEDPARIRARLDDFLDAHDLKASEYQAATIPENDRWTPIHRRVDGGDVYLVGDAAGQVKVSTVGGVVTGFKGALGVTQQILSHDRRMLRSLRLELAAHRLIRKALHRFDEDDYRFVIERLDDGAIEALSKSTRDDAVKALLSFARARPRVILRAVRALLLGS